MSVTCFTRQLNYLTGAGINTDKLQSRFYWDSNKFLLTIQHPPSNIPEISINEGFALSTIFCVLVLRVVNVSNHPRCGFCFTHMYANDDNGYHCTDNHGEHLKCCHGKSAFATSHNDIVSEFFEIGKTLFLTNDEWSGLVKVKYFSSDEANILKIVVTNTNGDNIVTTKEHLHSPSNPDI